MSDSSATKQSSHGPENTAGEMTRFDAAIQDELEHVTHLEYDAHEICKHFAAKVRIRMLKARAEGR